MKNLLQRIPASLRPVLWLALGLLAGYVLFSGRDGSAPEAAETHAHDSETVYTCSMHPQIRQNGPGKCPLCGMDLTPLESGSGEAFEIDRITLSEEARALAGIKTRRLASGRTTARIPVNGVISAREGAETRLTARIGGRIEVLHVNATGVAVQRGQLLAEVYSPELIAAQKELLELAALRQSSPALYESARRKLQSWNIPDEQIASIEKAGRPTERFPIVAPAGGTVTEIMVRAGDNVEMGMPLMTVTDLASVWAVVDIFEQDAAVVQAGDSLLFGPAAGGGISERTRLDFVAPVINPETRTATARATIAAGGRWKPGMLIRAVVASSLPGGIEIPATALLWAGSTSYVWVKRPDAEGAFEIREIRTGARTAGGWMVERGLAGGEEIAVEGVFRLDAAAQLSGRISMLNRPAPAADQADLEKRWMKRLLDSGTPKKSALPLETADLDRFARLMKSYNTLIAALVKSDASAARSAASDAARVASGTWTSADVREPMKTVARGLQAAAAAATIDGQRKPLNEASMALAELIERVPAGGEPLYLQYCPMARNDVGGFWISPVEDILNPYFGASMLGCGETITRLR